MLLLRLVYTQEGKTLFGQRLSQEYDPDQPYDANTTCLEIDANRPFYADLSCRSCAYMYENLTVWTGSKCVSCAEYDPNRPHWDGHQCVDACPRTPDASGECLLECPSDNPHWDGEECVEECPAYKRNLDEAGKCLSCYEVDRAAPVAYGPECVSCLEYNGTTPVWVSGECISCMNANFRYKYQSREECGGTD